MEKLQILKFQIPNFTDIIGIWDFSKIGILIKKAFLNF